jgi:hypothetical protein
MGTIGGKLRTIVALSEKRGFIELIQIIQIIKKKWENKREGKIGGDVLDLSVQALLFSCYP